MTSERMNTMKFTKKLKLITIAVSAAITVTAASLAFATDYGANDPLISKSYLESVFYPQLTAYIDARITAAAGSLSASTTTTQSAEYQIVTLYKGQSLYAKSSMEFILRPGASAVVISPSASNGIADLTNATELYNGNSVPINTYCVIPRGDGRGISCVSDTAYVMVRGAYEIK